MKLHNIALNKDIKNPAKRYVRHTLPKKCEPYKEVCWLTDLEDGTYDGKHKDHLARLYIKASLHAVDNFLQRLRRECACSRGRLQLKAVSATCGLDTLPIIQKY